MVREAGELREEITLESYDGESDTWHPLAREPKVWARPEANEDERYFFFVRWRADLFGFRDTFAAMRVRWRNRILEIEGVAETLNVDEVRITAKGIHIAVPEISAAARQVWKRWPA